MTPEEAERLRFEAAVREHQRAIEFEKAANQDAVDSGAQSLKAILLVNGGSCVAMLAFIGTLATKYRPISGFAFPLILFATGAGFAVLANAAGYFTNLLIVGSSREMKRQYVEPFLQDNDRSKRYRVLGEVTRWLAVGFAALGIISFFAGLSSAYDAFRQL